MDILKAFGSNRKMNITSHQSIDLRGLKIHISESMSVMPHGIYADLDRPISHLLSQGPVESCNDSQIRTLKFWKKGKLYWAR